VMLGVFRKVATAAAVVLLARGTRSRKLQLLISATI